MASRAAAHDTTASTERARPLVLIIDAFGLADGLALYAIALSAIGFDVAAALSTDEACARASELVPNIIVTEWPTRTGDRPDLMDRLNENPRTRAVPVVVIGDLALQSVRRTTDPRFAAFFPKPCSPYTLATGLRQLIEEK